MALCPLLLLLLLLLSGTTQVSWYQKGKTNLDFTEARDSEWQWHQMGHMQVCTSLQTENHASTPPLSFYRPDALPAAQPTASKHWRHKCKQTLVRKPEHPAKHRRQPRKFPSCLGTWIPLSCGGQQWTVTGTGWRCKLLRWCTNILQLLLARDRQREVLECLLCTWDLATNQQCMQGQCDARPMVTFPTTGHHCPWLVQIILLGDRDMHVNNLPNRLRSIITKACYSDRPSL